MYEVRCPSGCLDEPNDDCAYDCEFGRLTVIIDETGIVALNGVEIPEDEWTPELDALYQHQAEKEDP